MCLIWVLCIGLYWLVGFDSCLFFQGSFYGEVLSRLISFISCGSLVEECGFCKPGEGLMPPVADGIIKRIMGEDWSRCH